MKCEQCGTYFANGTAACPRCGRPVERAMEGESLPFGSPNTEESSGVPPWPVGKFILLCLIGLLIPLIGVVVGGINLLHPARKQQAIIMLALSAGLIVLMVIAAIA